MRGRAVKEWRGKTPDTKVPPRVRLRIWERENGMCHLSGRKILAGEPWDLDHKIALANGGEHRESNLFPAIRDKHKEKTKADVAGKSKVAEIAKKHIGASKPQGKLRSAGFAKSGKPPRIEKPTLPRRAIYEDVR
jgi:5-methylcytosine-specific restriction enzyme A